MNALLTGAMAGFVATVPMTAVMWALHPALPRRQRHPLPPYHITRNAARAAGADNEIDEPARVAATYAAHFSYGASAGGVYGTLSTWLFGSGKINHPIANGIMYGLLVWAGSYLGLLPAAGLYRSATREPAHRNALMVVAHVVWGAVLGGIMERVQSMSRRKRRDKRAPIQNALPPTVTSASAT